MPTINFYLLYYCFAQHLIASSNVIYHCYLIMFPRYSDYRNSCILNRGHVNFRNLSLSINFQIFFWPIIIIYKFSSFDEFVDVNPSFKTTLRRIMTIKNFCSFKIIEFSCILWYVKRYKIASGNHIATIIFKCLSKKPLRKCFEKSKIRN